LLDKKYIGRFAPSPTGRLHFGSLVAAVASYLDAKANSGKWLVRIEDVDGSRTVPGAASDILKTLEGYGMHHDGEVVVQSERSHIYRQIIGDLLSKDLAFGCACTRKDLESVGGLAIYPGTCKNVPPPGVQPRSVRFKMPRENLQWQDLIKGGQRASSASASDFIIKRADGYYAYHLAVVVDDAEAGVTRVVRGEDLLESTPSHIFLQQALGYATPEYAHFKLALTDEGTKLSKVNHAVPVEIEEAPEQLLKAFEFLGLAGIEADTPEKLLAGAVKVWHIKSQA